MRCPFSTLRIFALFVTTHASEISKIFLGTEYEKCLWLQSSNRCRIDSSRDIFLKLTVPKWWKGNLEDRSLLDWLECTAALSNLSEDTFLFFFVSVWIRVKVSVRVRFKVVISTRAVDFDEGFWGALFHLFECLPFLWLRLRQKFPKINIYVQSMKRAFDFNLHIGVEWIRIEIFS